jgi:hypothetical protein
VRRLNVYFFENFLAYAYKRGVPRSVGKMSHDILCDHLDRAAPTDQVEHVFDLVIAHIRKNPPPLPPPPIPRVRAQRPVEPEKPKREIFPVNERKINAVPLRSRAQRVYDSRQPLDEHMRTGFKHRVRAVDWSYYLHRDD